MDQYDATPPARHRHPYQANATQRQQVAACGATLCCAAAGQVPLSDA
eukprot:COSAG06_NODE_45420_length_355_cov_0.601562_1_plen_46_part_01